MSRPGFALGLALLMSLLLSGIALGMMAAGTHEAAIAGAATRRAQARASAESGARTIFREWSTRAFVDLEPGDGRSVAAGGATAAFVERVDSTLYLIRVEARVPAGSASGAIGAIGRAGLLVKGFDPSRTARSFAGAVTAPGAAILSDGVVDGQDRCGTGRDGPGLVAASLEADEDAVVRGSPAVLLSSVADPPRPDPLSPPLVAAIATILPTAGTLAPRPLTREGVCFEDSRNWGAIGPEHPCHALLPLVFADHDLTFSGGQARGVIVVAGDLRVGGGATVAGLVLVRGVLTVEAGSSIQGAVRADTLRLAGGAIHADPCTVDAALSAPALDRAYRPPGRWWVPVY